MAHPIDQTLKLKNSVQLVLKGMCMGVAEIIPGISGGTIAFLLGIYENFINSIKSFNVNFFKLLFQFKIKEAIDAVAWRYLVTLVAGMGASIILLSHGLSWMIEHHPVYIFSFFFGLILATAPIIARMIDEWNIMKIIVFCGVAIATYFFVALVPLQTPESLLFVFLCGAIAISAMILPGISGSFVLLLLGKYHFILNSVNQRDFLTIIVFLLGIVVGVLTFVRVLSWLFHRYHDMTLCVLSGFVIGSLNKIWPWKKTLRSMEGRHGEMIPIEQINQWPAAVDHTVVIALLAMIIGFTLAIILNRGNSSSFKGLNKS